MVVFADGSWKNEYAYYNASRSSIEYFSEKTYSIEELKEINNNIDIKMKMSNLAIKNNYFNYLNNSLNLSYSSMDPRTIPRLEALMKLRIKSRSSLGSYSVSMAFNASELLSPRV